MPRQSKNQETRKKGQTDNKTMREENKRTTRRKEKPNA